MANILVVDDNDGILEAMQAMLELDGHEVALCQSGQEALDRLQTDQHPEVILLDVLLFGMDGRDVCRQIKANRTTMNIPVIMVSAHPSAEQSIRSSGADDFLAKPFNMNTLLDKVKHYAGEQASGVQPTHPAT